MTIASSVRSIGNFLNNHGFTMVQLITLLILGLMVFFSGYVVNSDGYSAWMFFSTIVIVFLFVVIIFFLARKENI